MAEKMKALFRGEKAADGTPRVYLEGVPARALSQDEWDALTPEQQATVRRSGLYDVRSERDLAGTPAPVAEGKE